MISCHSWAGYLRKTTDKKGCLSVCRRDTPFNIASHRQNFGPLFLGCRDAKLHVLLAATVLAYAGAAHLTARLCRFTGCHIGGNGINDGIGEVGGLELCRINGDHDLGQAHFIAKGADRCHRVCARQDSTDHIQQDGKTAALPVANGDHAAGLFNGSGVGGQAAVCIVAAYHRQLFAGQTHRFQLAVAELAQGTMPASLAHNISEGGACLGVALKTKDENLRATAISAGISGLFGITEPALYGVTLQHKKVMMSVVASSFIGGLFVGLMKVKAFVAMGPGLAGMAMFVDPDNGKNILWAAVGLVISVVASFALSFFLYKDETPAEDETAAPAPETAADAAAADSTISSPLQGKAIALEEVKDEVFSQKILGDGIAVVPEKGELYAPADGVIESVFGTKHAISMKTNAGAELLMHIGMDTVKRDGKGFDPQVKDGETVKKGQLLMKFDLDGIKADGYDVTTPIVVTNADEFTIKTVAEGAVVPGAALLKLEANK